MKKKIVYYMGVLLVVGTTLIGCSNKSNNIGNDEKTKVESTNTSSDFTGGKMNSNGKIEDSKVIVDKEFSARDLEVGFEPTTATNVIFNQSSATITGSKVDESSISEKDGTVTIKSEGTYVFSGTYTQGQIVVDVTKKEKVQIVLDNVSITNDSGAAIYVKNGDKVFITMLEGTNNTLVDGSTYVQSDENTVDGVIFSKSDLTLNGAGVLNIIGNYKHGIVSKDKLVITSGTYHIHAVKDALNSKEGIKIKDGTFTLSSKDGNGMQSKNGDDETQGYIYIEGGEINVTTAVEGIEATAVVITGGIINLNVTDDGINSSVGSSDATEGTEQSDTTETTDMNKKRGMFGGENPFSVDNNCYIEILGGTITIDAKGDGIDSNGHVFIHGGTIYVNGPTNRGDGALDYNGTANITGGTTVIVGSVGMSQGFSNTSTQYSISYNLTEAQSAGTQVMLLDSKGNEIISYTPTKDYQSIVISSAELTKDNTYTIKSGELSEEITLTEVVTSIGTTGMGRNGMGGPGGIRERKYQNGEMPEGFEPPLTQPKTSTTTP